jgi:hypothetical protein
LRLQLRRASARTALAGLVGLAALLAGGAAPAEDRVTIRGAYYREVSTKVVQPMVQVSKDLPHGFDASVHGLVDAITSPSVLTGVVGDNIFTEYRKEAGVVVGKTFDRTHASLAYRQSREPDYISHSIGLQATQGIWENTGTLALSLAYSTDTIGPNLNNSLEVLFASLAYNQALSPVMVAEARYELVRQSGYICNPYDQDARGRAVCPKERVRHAAVARLARYFPSLAAGVQLHYRLYYDQRWDSGVDPWGMFAHSVEARLYKEVTPTLELRFAYRFHTQSYALFWWCNGDPSRASNPDCGGDILASHSSDQKFGPLKTHLAEVKLVWEARALGHVPLLAWFALGAFELSYGRYFQVTHYGDAHLLQTGYSLPF